MFVALRLIKEADLSNGHTAKIGSPASGVVGALFVFETEAAMRKLYGDDADWIEISFKNSPSEDRA